MAKTFYLEIIAADHPFYRGRAVSLIYTTKFGEAEVLANHTAQISALADGLLRYKTEDGLWHVGIAGVGVMRFTNNRCRVLVDTCEKPEEIDRARAEAALSRAKEKLRQKKSNEEYYLAQAALARAFVRLKETSGK